MLNALRIIILIVVLAIPLYIVVNLLRESLGNSSENPLISSSEKKVVMEPIWKVRSVDTVKYSRDVAREKKDDQSYDEVINEQVKNIANLGATHVAIGTPYDPEFVPFTKRWVNAARKNRLHIYFRGNLAGWEKWFGYKKIDKEAHMKGIKEFIVNNPDLFEEGDIFTSCTECENGALGDPRQTRKIEEYRQFLVEENRVAQEAFKEIGKPNVTTNYYSMNGDVAKLIMDRDTTAALGGIVAIDHYVKSAEKLNRDITEIAEKSGGKVVLSEWGAPILDIHGEMTEEQQASWVADAFEQLSQNPNLVGVNYWTSYGSSTALWKGDGSEKAVVNVVRFYFNKRVGRVID